jgi:hypothetical protein
VKYLDEIDQSLCVVDVKNSTKWNCFLGQLCFVEACDEFCDKNFVKMNLLQVSICIMEIFYAWHALHFNVLIKAQRLPPWWNLGPNNTREQPWT